MSKLLRNGLCIFLCVLMAFAVVPAQAFASEIDVAETGAEDESGKPETIKNSEGETNVANEWKQAYPYGVFAFGEYGYAAEEGGDVLTVPVYRLGGTEGRATAYVIYNPLVNQLDENKFGYANALSTDDVEIEVEDPSPIAMYQPLGKGRDPEPGDLKLNAEQKGSNYAISLSKTADSYKWQSKDDYGWSDCFDLAEDSITIDKETYDYFDYRCIYTIGDDSYCTESLKGEKYVKPEPEVLPEQPEDLDIGPATTYTKLEPYEEDAYNAYVFDVTFADGEWVKYIRFTPLEDELSECAEVATLIIQDCEGGCINKSYNSATVTVKDNDPAEPFELGFTEKEIKADKADGSVKVTVRRDGGFQEAVSIDCETVNGTAVAGVDYIAFAGTMAFCGDINEMSFDIQLIDNGLRSDTPKTFTLRLKELKGDGDGLCTLTNTELTVSLTNSGGVDKINLATKLAEPDAIDLSASQDTASEVGVVDTAPDTVTGAQVEEPEPVYAEIVKGRSAQGMLKSYRYSDLLSFTGSYDWMYKEILYEPFDFQTYGCQKTDPMTIRSNTDGSFATLSVENMSHLYNHGRIVSMVNRSLTSRLDAYTKISNGQFATTVGSSFDIDISKGYNLFEVEFSGIVLGSGYTDFILYELDFYRRVIQNQIALKIHTANDGETGHGDATAPEGAVVFTDDQIYDDLKPNISIVPNQGGVIEDGKLFVGSKLKIEFNSSTPRSFSLLGNDGLPSIYLTNSEGRVLKRAEPGENGVYYLTLDWDDMTVSDLEDNLTINVAYDRKQELALDFTPSVPRCSDGMTPDLENHAAGAFNDFWDENNADSKSTNHIEFGYTSLTANHPFFSKDNVRTGVITKDSCKFESSDGKAVLSSASAVPSNIHWINFHRKHDDFIVINGKTYAGDEKIYLSLSEFNLAKLRFLYYSAEYASVPTKMSAEVDRMELYLDADANGKIDGYADENGFFHTDDKSGDVLLAVIDEGGNYPEDYYNMWKNEDGSYSQLFFKFYYTMTPRKLTATDEEKATGRAQLLPVFDTAVTDPAKCFGLTDEQKQVRYIISGQYSDDDHKYKDGTYMYTSDEHPMYGVEATALQYVDIPLGGDKSPVSGKKQSDGTINYSWAPEYEGNLMFPYDDPKPIYLEETMVGNDYPIAPDYDRTGTLSEKDIKNLNGYLGSYVSQTDVSLCVFEQEKTVGSILEGTSSSKKLTKDGTSGNPDDDENVPSSPEGKAPCKLNETYSNTNPPDLPSSSVPNVSTQAMDGLTLGYDSKIPYFSFGLRKITVSTNGHDLILGVNIPVVTYNWPVFASDNNSFINGNVYPVSNGETRAFYSDYKDAIKAISSEGGLAKALEQSPQIKEVTDNPNGRPEVHFAGFSCNVGLSIAFQFKYDSVKNQMLLENNLFAVAITGSFSYTVRFLACPYLYICFTANLTNSFGSGYYQKEKITTEPLYKAEANAQALKKDQYLYPKEVLFGDTVKDVQKITFALGDEGSPFSVTLDGNELKTFSLTEGETMQGQYVSLTAIKGSIDNNDWKGTGNGDSFKFYCANGIRWIEVEWKSGNTASITSSGWTTSGNKATWHYFAVDYKSLSVDFEGKIGFELYTDATFKEKVSCANTGFIQSENRTQLNISLLHCDGYKMWDKSNDKETVYYMRIRALEDGAKIYSINKITNKETSMHPRGFTYVLSPSFSAALGLGAGSLMNLEVCINAYCSLTIDAKLENDHFIRYFDWGIALSLNASVLVFNGAVEIASVSQSYNCDTGWGKVQFHYPSHSGRKNSSLKRGDGVDYDSVFKLPEDTSDTQTIYTPDKGSGSSGLLKSFAPTDTSVPFELSGYYTSSDAAKLADGLVNGYDYRVVTARNADGKDVNYVIYHISRDKSASSIDQKMLVMSELVMTGNEKGLVNPVDPSSTTPYIVVDVDDKGEPDGAVDVDFSAEAIDGGSRIRVVWTSNIDTAKADTRATIEALGDTAKKMVVKTATFTPGDTSFAAAETIDDKGDENADDENGECVQIPDLSEDAVVYVRSNHIKEDELEARTALYEDYLVGRGYDVNETDTSEDAQVRKSYATSLVAMKRGLWTTSGGSSDLCVKIGDSDVSSVPMSNGVIIDSAKIEKTGDKYFIAYTTSEECYTDAEGNILETASNISNLLTVKRMYLRTCTLGKDKDGKDIVEWGMDGKAVLLRTLFDYDDNGNSDSAGIIASGNDQQSADGDTNKLCDGIYVNGTIENKDNPYFGNLQFLNADLGNSLSGTSEEFPLKGSGAEDFLLFDMCGSTYIIRQSDLEAMTGSAINADGSGTEGTIIPFFTPDMENADEDNYAVSSGRTEVTIGVDGDGNLAAVYSTAVSDTNNTALCISKYDPETGVWGDKTILAMNYLGVYEDNLRNYRSNEDSRKAFFGVLEPKDDDEAAVQGGLNEFKFNNPQIALGKETVVENGEAVQHPTLLILTQGTMKYLQANTNDDTKDLIPYVPVDDSVVNENPGNYERSDIQPPGVGIYAIEYGSGTQAVGSIQYSLLEDDYSVGATPYANISFENTGDVAIRGSEQQPITVSLIASDSDAPLAEWKLTENVIPGQKVALSGDLTLTETLPVGTKLYLRVSEDSFYESSGGTPFSAVSQELAEIEEHPELAIRNADVDFDLVHEDGDTLIDFEFDADNRGTADADGVYAQFSYDTGEVDEDGNEIFEPLDISKEDIYMNESILNPGLFSGRANGKLDIGDIDVGCCDHIYGKLKISSGHFNEKTTDAFVVRIELFSKADNEVFANGEPQSGVHNEYNRSNNMYSESAKHQTVFTAPGFISVPKGTEIHIPVGCKYTMGDETPHILAREFDDVDGEYQFSSCAFRYGEFGSGKGSGILELKAEKEGSGYLRIKDVSTGSYFDIAYVVTEPVDGINVDYTENGIFRFYNADGSDYETEGTNQSWRFPTGVSQWGADNTAPYLNDLAMGAVERGNEATPVKEGGYFKFKTDAESIDFVFSGKIKVESDFNGFEPVVVTASGGDGDDPAEYATVFFGNNPKELVHTVTVTALDGDDDPTSPFKYASFDRIIEHYDPYELPIPDEDLNAPEIYFCRSFPESGSVAETVDGKPNSVTINAYVFDATGIASVAVNGKHVNILDRSEYKFWTVAFEFSGNGDYEIMTTDDLGNLDKHQIHVDWFGESGESGLSAVPTVEAMLMKRGKIGENEAEADTELTDSVPFTDEDKAYISASGKTSSGSGVPEISTTEITVTGKDGLISFPVEADEDGAYPVYSKGWYLVKAVDPDSDDWSLTAVEMMRFIKNQLYITADEQKKHPGDPDPELTYTAVGFMPGDELSGSLSRVEGEEEGTYAITQGTLAADEDYGIIYKGADLIISHDYSEPEWIWGFEVDLEFTNGSVLDIHPNYYTFSDNGDTKIYKASAFTKYVISSEINGVEDCCVILHDGEDSAATYNIVFKDLPVFDAERGFVEVNGDNATVNLTLDSRVSIVSDGVFVNSKPVRTKTAVNIAAVSGLKHARFMSMNSGTPLASSSFEFNKVGSYQIEKYDDELYTEISDLNLMHSIEYFLIKKTDATAEESFEFVPGAEAVFTCSTCGHTVTELDTALERDDVPTECLMPGGQLYHASVDFRGKTYTDNYFIETEPAYGHDYIAVVTEPTCTKKGYTTYTCSRCGDSYKDDYTDALGHDCGDPVWEWHDGLKRVGIHVENNMVIDFHPDHYTVNGGDPVMFNSDEVNYVLSGNPTSVKVVVHDGESSAATYNISFRDLNAVNYLGDFFIIRGSDATVNLSLCGRNSLIAYNKHHVISGSGSNPLVVLSVEGDSLTRFEAVGAQVYCSGINVEKNEDSDFDVFNDNDERNNTFAFIIRGHALGITPYHVPLRHASATFTCSRCGDLTENDYEPVPEEIPAGCETDAVTRQHAKVTFEGKEYTHDFDFEQQGTAIGHLYGDPVWKWSFGWDEVNIDLSDGATVDIHPDCYTVDGGEPIAKNSFVTRYVFTGDNTYDAVKRINLYGGDSDVKYNICLGDMTVYEHHGSFIAVEGNNVTVDLLLGNPVILDTGYHVFDSDSDDTVFNIGVQALSYASFTAKDSTVADSGITVNTVGDCGFMHIKTADEMHTAQQAAIYNLNESADPFNMPYHAEATFICTRCKDVQTVEAVVTEEERDGKTVRVATAVLDNVSYTDVMDSYFIAHSLSLNGSIGVNYYLNLTNQEIKDGAKVDFAWTVAGKEKTHSVTLTADDFTSNGYRATCPIAIAEMIYDITATLSIGGKVTETDTYSAKQYSDVILNNEGGFKEKYISAENDAGRNGDERYNELITLVKTMLDYGTKAQVRFERNTDQLANGGTDFFTGEVDIPNSSDDMSADLSVCGLEYFGTSVVYLSETTLRHYYKITEPDLFTEDIQNGITFDGEAVTCGTRNDTIYFDKKNIAASQLDTEYVISINGKEYQYSALDYSALSYSKDDKSYSDSIAKQLAASVYRYNQAANDFFGD